MPLRRELGGFYLELGTLERHESSLDDRLEDRTHDDQPFGYPRDSVIQDLLTENERKEKDLRLATGRCKRQQLQIAALEEKVAALEAVLAAPIAQEGEG